MGWVMNKRRQDEELSGVLWFLTTTLGGSTQKSLRQEESGWATSKEHFSGGRPSWQSQGKTVTKLEGANFFRRFLYSSRRSATSPRASSLSTIRARERLAVMFFMILPRISKEKESVNAQEQQGKGISKGNRGLWKEAIAQFTPK